MKKITLLLLAVCVALSAQAQTYAYSQTIGAPDGYNWNSPNTSTIMSAPSNEELSSWQTLPFDFEYFGQTVDGYYVSDNGYITFDQAAATSDPNTTQIPAAAGPNHAIYAFWEDLELASGAGTADEVRSWTYQEGNGNQVHVIQWHSVTDAGGSFVYAAILLYECGDFNIILPYSNSSVARGTIGCENEDGTAGVQIFGSPNLPMPTLAADASDDVVYSFFYSEVANDASIQGIVTEGDFIVAGGSTPLTVKLKNTGGSPLNSATINYLVNGGNLTSETITGLSILPGYTADVSFTGGLSGAGAGDVMNLCVFVSEANGVADERACNDQYCKDLLGINGNSGGKRVLIEEFTGAWCGWCPDGLVVVENIKDNNPATVSAVSIHDGDGMEYNEGIRDAFDVTGYPNGQVDRTLFPGEAKIPHSRGAWANNTAASLNEFTPLNIMMNHTYDPATRQVDINVDVNFVDYAMGDKGLHFFFVEDSITGTGSGYNQVNYLNGQAGHPYFGAGDPIVGFVHRFVLRDNPYGVYGFPLTLASPEAPGSVINHTYSYTLPANWDENQMSIICFVADRDENIITNNKVWNVVDQKIGETGTTSLEDEMGAELSGVYPNPVKGLGYAAVSFKNTTYATFEVMNPMGQVISTLKEGNFGAGEHKVYFDTSDVPAGVYFLNVRTDRGTLSYKIIVL